MHLHSLPLLRIWLSISVPVQGAESSAIAKSGPSENSTTSTQSTPAEFILHHAIASKLASGPASGVRKMRADEGEKFFFEDWYFGDERADSSGLSERGLSHQNWNESSNLSTELEADAEDGDEDGDQYNRTPARFIAQSFPFESSFPPFSGSNLNLDPASEARSRLEARNFECPTGTSACTSIGRSDRCCGSGETCEIVADTGYGTVGCCPSSKECSGAIGSCPSGYSACASALGGGCCIPGYDCVAGGCAYITAITVTIHSTVTVSTVTYSTSPVASSETSSTSSSTSSSSSKSTSTSSQTTATETTDSLTPPARPTSLSTATSAATGDDVCPTGFYACSAVYHGGCCRTGRDCDTTSCPTTSSTTMTSNGVTIVAPVATTAEDSGGSEGGNRCANGWFSCADTVGGGCCPTGFACGGSCTATDTASATTVAKEQATNGAGTGRGMSRVMLGVSILGGLLLS